VLSSHYSTFSLENPLSFPLDQLLALGGKSPSPEIQLQMKDYEFYQIRLACTFIAEGWRFCDARLDIVLQTSPNDPNTVVPTALEQAIAYDLTPMKAEDGSTTRVGGKLGFPIPGSPYLEYGTERTVNKSSVEAIGLLGPRPGWIFAHTQTHEISGSQPLSMLVRKPKGTKVQATFRLTAHVQLVIGHRVLEDPLSLLTLFRRHGSSATITDPTVPLC
jgi:hypothetical protein